jgi:hypothetical protein
LNGLVRCSGFSDFGFDSLLDCVTRLDGVWIASPSKLKPNTHGHRRHDFENTCILAGTNGGNSTDDERGSANLHQAVSERTSYEHLFPRNAYHIMPFDQPHPTVPWNGQPDCLVSVPSSTSTSPDVYQRVYLPLLPATSRRNPACIALMQSCFGRTR